MLTLDRATVINLSQPLPDDTSGAMEETHPWLIELADGQQCGAADGATTTVGGLRLNYRCGNGSIYGYPDASAPVWSVRYQADNSNAIETVPVATIFL